MEVIIEKLDHFGRGITHIKDKITFVNNALIGEKVDIKIVKDKKKFLEADAIKIIECSDKRCNIICPYYNDCGGCNLLHMTYQEQLSFKENKVKNIIKRYTNIDTKIIKNIIPSKEYNYRNKITLHVKDNKIGLYKNKSNEIIEIDNCLLVDENINNVIVKLKKLVKETKHDIKNIIIKKADEILINITGEVDINYLKNNFSEYNIEVNNKSLIKNNFIIGKIFNKKFYISSNSFYQVNTNQIENLYGEAIKHIKNKKYKNVLDLYCGTGTIGIIVSDYVEKVTGIESCESSYKDALKNKDLNNINDIDFILGKVEDNIENFKNIDLVIVDPPRSGLDKYTISTIKEIKPNEIIYISCDPITLARDLNILNETYDILEITPVDMFPNTYHVECVCILKADQTFTK